MEVKLIKGSVLLRGKTASFIFDPEINGGFEADAAIFSKKQEGVFPSRLSIFGPGEYEIKGVQILGLGNKGINYKIKIDGLRVAVVSGEIKEKEEETFSDLDVLVLSSRLASQGESAELVLKLEPKIVVLCEVQEGGLLKELGQESIVSQPRLMVSREKLPGETQVVVLR